MEDTTLKIIAIIIFALTYIALLVFSKHRAFIALGSAIIFIIMGALPIGLVPSTIDWNLLLMLFGIMGTVALFIESGMTAVIGGHVMKKSPNLKWAIVILSLLSGIISAFADNVATVLILAPIALSIAKKAQISPVPLIIAIAIMSNLQGAATLVGDTTSILLGAETGMNFYDFFFYQGKVSLFFIIQVSMLVVTLFLMFCFRKYDQKIDCDEIPKATSVVPSVALILTILLLIVFSFFQEKLNFAYTNGIICVAMFAIALAITTFKDRRKERLIKVIKDIDFLTLLLIGSLLIIVGGIEYVGFINDIAYAFTKISSNPLVIYIILVGASVVLSAFIDNIPYVAAMLPVAAGIAASLGIDPHIFYFGLISGATLGGNITPIGASANITAMGILRKEGYNVKIGEFMKISVPFTLLAVLSGSIMIWFIWS